MKLSQILRWRKPVDFPVPLGECKFSVIDEKPATFSDVLGYYERLRNYVQHEDNLLNSRLTWSLTVHGFLFAIFGVLTGKIADLFIGLQKTRIASAPAEIVISGLFFLQVPVAIFGVVVAYMSRNAIVAAHNALQHLYTISQFSGLLSNQGKETTLEGDVREGKSAFKPALGEGIQDGACILVDSGSTSLQEFVRATKSTETLEAYFAKPHKAGTTIKQLGIALLPHIVSGGARSSNTDGAHSFYLSLPICAMIVWLVLLSLAVFFFVSSFWFPCWFFGYFLP